MAKRTLCLLKTNVIQSKKKREGGYLMKISFQMSGGFAYIPALSKPFVVDTEKVEPGIAKELEDSVREARVFDRPAQVGSLQKGAADYRTYTLVVEDGDTKHSIVFTDPISDASLQNLVSRIKDLSRPSGRG